MLSELPIGELFILGFDNSRIDVIEDFHARFGLGGVILFSRNIESSQKVVELTKSLRDRTEPTLLVAIDQEGGRVCRIADSEFPVFPSPSYYGHRGDLEGARNAARVTAKMLRQLGINLNLNPVADVLVDPESTLLRDRAYSSITSDVCEYVRAVVEEQTVERVASCAKHFPGLGGSSIDPHQKMASSNRSAEFYRERLLPPFKAAMSTGCAAIMTTHIVVPSLDEARPTTFSSSIVSGVLRKELDFEGVILSDDLDMGAVMSENEAVKMALQAGHDMVLICHSIDKQIACAEMVAKAATDGSLNPVEIAASVQRVMALKRGFARA
jgi:beta-N-acetylhexosaminidase